jgi:hypothetical protein
MDAKKFYGGFLVGNEGLSCSRAVLLEVWVVCSYWILF